MRIKKRILFHEKAKIKIQKQAKNGYRTGGSKTIPVDPDPFVQTEKL